jgi:hypothetical protein
MSKYLSLTLLLLLACGGLSSCFLLWSSMKTRCCYFDPSQNKITLNCPGQKIKALRVILTSVHEPSLFDSVILEGTVADSNEFTIPRPADSTLISKIMYICVWYENYVIWDYTITVKLGDWNSGKLLYGHYSYR